MKIVADLHLHSHFSRATSKNLNLEHLSKWAQHKGVQVVGTGDIAHPGWLAEMKKKLEPAEEGLFRLKDEFARPIQREVFKACHGPVRFMLAGEISNIYKKNEKVRKIHNVVFLPSFDAVEKFQAQLEKIGNIRSDGRPILGLDSRDLLEIVLETDPHGYLIPAHIWTPWFALFGSMSGFDSIEECFEELTPHIFALETGLSSDPPMNWRLSALDDYTLVSNSDAHSPPKLAREANLFNTELSYPAIFTALKTNDPNTFNGTIEFFPEEGKYHYDGHRKCGVRWAPQKTIAHGGMCPECGNKVTVGVMHRVETLADRDLNDLPPNRQPYKSLIPLPEILAGIHDVGVNTKRVTSSYETLLSKLAPELEILQSVPLEDLEKFGGSLLGEGIRRMRNGELHIAAGYDGEFGKIQLFEKGERQNYSLQLGFFPEKNQPPKRYAHQIDALSKEDSSSGSSRQKPVTRKHKETREIHTHDSDDTSTKNLHLAENILFGLNSAQREAAQHTQNTLLIVAGPGTGKTRTLTHRIAYLIRAQRISPRAILAIAFTNKATQEIMARLVNLVGEKDAHTVTVKTFHALGVQILRDGGDKIGLTPEYRLCNDSERLSLFRRLNPTLDNQECTHFLKKISSAKIQLLTPKLCEGAPQFAQTADFIERYRVYQGELRRNRILDYDDLIFLAEQCLEQNPEVAQKYRQRFRWISVDEYQDINFAQYRLLKCLMSDESNLCVIGDPDQAIYGFRGTKKEFFLKFEEDFPQAKIVKLEKNYRSSRLILNAARQIIKKSELHIDRSRVWSEIVSQNKIVTYQAATDKAEAEFVVHEIEKMVGGTSYFSMDSGRVHSGTQGSERTFSDFVVLFRVGIQSRLLAEALNRSSIPFQTVGETPFFERKAVKEWMNYLWFIHEPNSDYHLLHLLSNAKCGLGEKNLKRVEDYAQKTQTPIWQLLQEENGSLKQEFLRHQSFLPYLKNLRILLENRENQPISECLDIVTRLFYSENYVNQDEKRREIFNRLLLKSKPFGSHLKDFLEYTVLQQESDDYDNRAERVTLMTLHAAKGLEFPVVFIVGCEEGLIPFKKDSESMDVDEERRLFYVGMTRAQHQLILTSAKRRFFYGRTQRNAQSRFVHDIEESIKEVISRQDTRRTKEQEADDQLQLF